MFSIETQVISGRHLIIEMPEIEIINLRIFQGWKLPDAGVKKLQDHRRSRNWILFHFHYQQTLLKMYPEPKTCNPIETFIPRGRRMIDNIKFRKNRIHRKFIN